MPEPQPAQASGTFVAGTVEVPISGGNVRVNLSVPAAPSHARQMLPILQSLTNKFVEIGQNRAEQTGARVSCKAGCGACCRHVVPLSEIEVQALAEYVLSLPEPRRAELIARFEQATHRLREAGLLDRILASGAAPVSDATTALGLDYFDQQIPCPFLENESCSIHPNRPMACREHLVVSDPANCARPREPHVHPVKIPILFSAAARALRADPSASKTQWIPLTYALQWAAAHPDRGPQKPGTAWIEELFKNLKSPQPPS
jgi:Fe-S-cluster containining protein